MRKRTEKRLIKVDAICPKCGIIHEASIEYEWSGKGVPRIYCKRHESLRTYNVGRITLSQEGPRFLRNGDSRRDQ